MSIIYLRANARNWTRRPNARAEKASAIAIAIAMAMATATVVDSSNGDGGSNNDNTNGDRAPLYGTAFGISNTREVCMGWRAGEVRSSKKKKNRGRLTFGHQSE